METRRIEHLSIAMSSALDRRAGMRATIAGIAATIVAMRAVSAESGDGAGRPAVTRDKSGGKPANGGKRGAGSKKTDGASTGPGRGAAAETLAGGAGKHPAAPLRWRSRMLLRGARSERRRVARRH